MEQQIRFCTTADGVRIAYATVGEGPPLVKAANWLTHLEFDWESPVWRHMLHGLAQYQLLVRYDERGTGLSQRDVEEITFDGWVADLEAVVDALDLERCPVLGISQGGPIAIAYAHRHPDRVSHLILYATFGRWPRPLEIEDERQLYESVLTLTRLGWGQDNPAFRQMFTTLMIPGGDAEQIGWFNELMRVSASPDIAVKIMETLPGIDVMDMAAQLTVPTLVLHRRGDQGISLDAGRELASVIPNARFVPLEGENHYFLEGEKEVEKFFAAIAEFLGWPETPRQPESVSVESIQAPLTILFTDVEGSTALTQRLGDAKARELLREHERLVREALKAHGGAEVKTMGDGFMASFSSVTRALESAIAMQRAFAEHNESAKEPIRVRIGLNAGEPIAEEDPDGRSDLFGTAVILAARIAAKAEGGEILTSDTVRGLVAGKKFLFADRGDTALRGFEDPVRLYEVSWREEE